MHDRSFVGFSRTFRSLSAKQAILFGLFASVMLLGIYGPDEQEILRDQLTWKRTVACDLWFWGSIYGTLTFMLVSCSVPVASGLMVVGGFLFGLWPGLLIVHLGATFGSVLAMLSSRYLFQDAFRRFVAHRPRLSSWMNVIDQGIAREGGYFLLVLRLTPIIPFFVVNSMMGLTRIRVIPYFRSTLVGMLPTTIVLVNTGAAMAQIHSLRDLISLQTLTALMLLLIVPLGLRLLLARPRQNADAMARNTV